MIKIKNLAFKNPLILASGTFGFGDKFTQVANKMGGLVTKGITLQPRLGNPMPRICETPAGILNAVGLENPGIQMFVKEILPKLQYLKTNLIVNIAGNTISEYATIAEILDNTSVAAIEINISCPNLKDTKRKSMIGQNPKTTYQVVKAVRKKTRKPIITKLTANFIDPLLTGKAAVEAGSDAISLINTLYGIAFNLKTRQPMLGAITGGLSGPAIKPFALYCVWRLSQYLKVPIVGCGGITNASDVQEFLLAGAQLVEIGSANLRNPYIGLDILKNLK
ncbi:MAG: dihydroorotate dehydrogenase [candidate division WOR-3 bacterium]